MKEQRAFLAVPCQAVTVLGMVVVFALLSLSHRVAFQGTGAAELWKMEAPQMAPNQYPGQSPTDTNTPFLFCSIKISHFL